MNIINKGILGILRRLFWFFIGLVLGECVIASSERNYSGFRTILYGETKEEPVKNEIDPEFKYTPIIDVNKHSEELRKKREAEEQ